MQKNKLVSFIVDLELFISSKEEGIEDKDITLTPLFYNVIENLEKLDDSFSVEKGMDLREHIYIKDGNLKENDLVLSEKLLEAIKIS
jgi:hypothetical protein